MDKFYILFMIIPCYLQQDFPKVMWNVPSTNATFEFESFPQQGPVSGGTLLQIYGENCSTIDSIAIRTLANQSLICDIIRQNETMVTCVTTGSGEPVAGEVVVTANHSTVISAPFFYRDDPQIFYVFPERTIVSGGLTVTVQGWNLDVIQKPQILALSKMHSSPCTVLIPTVMICVTPDLGSEFNLSTIPRDGHVKVDYGFIMDNVTDLLNMSLITGEMMLVCDDPVLFAFDEGNNHLSKDNTIIIKGRGIHNTLQAHDIVVTIAGRIKCDVTAIYDDRVIVGPVDLSRLHGHGPHRVTVQVGNLNFNIGRLHRTRKNTLWMAIFFPVILVIVLVISGTIGFLMRKKNRSFNVQDDKRKAAYSAKSDEVNIAIESYDFPVYVDDLLRAIDIEEQRRDIVETIIPRNKLTLIKQTGRDHTRNSMALLDVRKSVIFGEERGGEDSSSVWSGRLEGDTDTSEGIKVAVRVINGLSLDSAEIGEVMRECVMARRFDHRNVLSVLGVGIDLLAHPMLVMPHLPLDVRTYVKNNRIIQLDCIMIGIQVAQGMAYLSHHGIIHTNLAARNCFMDSEEVVKISDFCLSGHYCSEPRHGDRWRAPECRQSSPTFTLWSDVWSFGVVVWELFTKGQTPIQSSRLTMLLKGQTPARDRRLSITSGDIHHTDTSNRRASDVHKTNQTQNKRLSTLLGQKRISMLFASPQTDDETLPQPRRCPDSVYEVMLQCWAEHPEDRPSFAQLVLKFKDILNSAQFLEFL